MSRYVDLSEQVTATYYDEQYEEWDHHTVTVEDVLNEVCDDYTVMPSAQPEITYCQDCKYRGVGNYFVYKTRLAWITGKMIFAVGQKGGSNDKN